ncbi:MAG: hypothetical protein GY942_09205 [Aestuariibacter sp.]|nr:hypothetical protein [Aestuariibacter sp.]
MHEKYFKDKPVITMAHNYMWNVNTQVVDKGFPGMVVGQYQASLPEFSEWTKVPNPIPAWHSDFNPGLKDSSIAIAYTPSGKHEKYPPSHHLYWHSKGYQSTMAALENLAKRHSINLHVIGARQVTFSQSMEMKKRLIS